MALTSGCRVVTVSLMRPLRRGRESREVSPRPSVTAREDHRERSLPAVDHLLQERIGMSRLRIV